MMAVLCIKTGFKTNSIPTGDREGKEGQVRGQEGQGERSGEGRQGKERQEVTGRARRQKWGGQAGQKQGREERKSIINGASGEMAKWIKCLPYEHEVWVTNGPVKLRHIPVIPALWR